MIERRCKVLLTSKPPVAKRFVNAVAQVMPISLYVNLPRLGSARFRPRTGVQCARFSALLNRFRRDTSGNIAVIFAIASLPIMSAVGCAVDYSRATQLRSKLQAAIDAASVGSVARSSPGFIAAGSMTVGWADPGRRDRCHQYLQRQHERRDRLHAQQHDAGHDQDRERHHVDGSVLRQRFR